jgi:glycogen phosphorylase
VLDKIHIDNPAVAEIAAESAGDPDAISAEILEKLTHAIGKDPIVAEDHDWLEAAILALRDRIIDRWMATTRDAYRNSKKRVYYLSLEFLIGRLFADCLNNLGLTKAFSAALAKLGVDLDRIAALEPDAALGNGGLGRLAACYMESMATVGIPAYGYGIRYDHGLFRQEIADGWQVELPEEWLSNGNPWEFPRREVAYEIGFGGSVQSEGDGEAARFHWTPSEKALAVGFDTPIVGWRGGHVNTLRLWHARAVDPIKLDAFNRGDYAAAMSEHTRAEIMSRVLYPSDATPAGQELRFRQEYFFTSASVQDLLRRHFQQFGSIHNLAEKAAIQLNDTHPAIAIAELMRLLVDLHGASWREAWEITRNTTAYTNHTLLPEALESWPVQLFDRLLPRHMQIIYRINAGVIADARVKRGFEHGALAAVSLIDEHNGRRVRMGQLAFVGSHSINGVSALHTELMKNSVFRDLNVLYPGRINNKTNGITPRRWLQQINPALTSLLLEAIGPGFLDDAEALSEATRFALDPGFRARFAAIKRANKEKLARFIANTLGVHIDASAMFDVQIKRIHEYKRQLLNILETVALYNAMRAHPDADWPARVKIFAGKAAASYWQAKMVVKLVNDVAYVINNDPAVRGLLKVVFLPNYNVSLAEMIIPAADLSEQISTAGMEASGTGNMKLALNGALTIGTLDGANIEIRDRVGAENITIFGLTASEVAERRHKGLNSREIINASPHLREVLESLATGVYSPEDVHRYRPIVDPLYDNDWFMVTADFEAYWEAQRSLDAVWRAPDEWTAKAIRNMANVGWFSSDRAIREYARDIWNVPTSS